MPAKEELAKHDVVCEAETKKMLRPVVGRERNMDCEGMGCLDAECSVE
jgi:hypothetical protein